MNRLTRKEAAQYIGCSESALYALEKSGRLDGTFYRIGKRRYYITSKLDNWMMNGGTDAPEGKGKEVITFE